MMRLLLKGLGLVLATLILHLILIQPNHPAAMTWGALRLFPLELPFIVLALIALPAKSAFTIALRGALAVALVVIAVLKVADFALFTAFGRAFNPLIDVHLIEAGFRLSAGAVGLVPAIAGAVVAVCLPFIAGFAIWWATGRWAEIEVPPKVSATFAIASLAALGIVIAEIGAARRAWALPIDPPGAAFTFRVALERATTYRALLADLENFRIAAETDRFDGAENLLDVLDGRDVLIVYVESYGRTSFDNPLYAPTHLETLRQAEEKLDDAGLAMVSGWLTAPISGGQSWLAHGTLASGLSTGNQARYAAMLASPRRTLFHLAAQAGYHTAAVMPAIVLPWPEANLLGFQRVYAAADLGYQGQPFNWVTMPDQYTLSVFDRLFPGGEDPLFAQIALISSHAPWVPIPEMIDWDDVGDGTIFDQWATSGDPPSVVWRDRDRVRDQYRQSIDYALEVAFDHTARNADKDRLVIVLGDHPPAAFVSQIESFDVPIHVIGSPELIEAVADWEWTAGLIPNARTPVWSMEAFRDRFLRAFSSDPPAET
jgi:hypothetical protein